MGSPPRVREVFTEYENVMKAKGITPACAGSISGVEFAIIRLGDHPRVCGKYREI